SNIVVSELSGGSTAGSAAAAAFSGTAGFSCARNAGPQPIHSRQAVSSCGANRIPRPMLILPLLLSLMAAVLPRCGFLRPRNPGHTASDHRSPLRCLKAVHVLALHAQIRLQKPH